MQNLRTQLRNHADQLETKLEGFEHEQGIQIPVYLLMRSIRLIRQAEQMGAKPD